MIENVPGGLEPEGSDLALTMPEAGEDPGTTEVTVEEVPTDRNLEVGLHEVVEVDEEGEENGKAHPSTPPTIKNPPSPPFFEVGHIRATMLSTNQKS